MRSFAIVIRRAYFEVKKRRKYAKNVVINRSVTLSETTKTGFSRDEAHIPVIQQQLNIKPRIRHLVDKQ